MPCCDRFSPVVSVWFPAPKGWKDCCNWHPQLLFLLTGDNFASNALCDSCLIGHSLLVASMPPSSLPADKWWRIIDGDMLTRSTLLRQQGEEPPASCKRLRVIERTRSQARWGSESVSHDRNPMSPCQGRWLRYWLLSLSWCLIAAAYILDVSD